MLGQPGGQRGSLAVRQQVDRPVAGHVDQDGAVGRAAPEGEVIDAEHGHSRRRRYRLGADETDQQVFSARHAQLGGQPGAGPAGQRQRDRHQLLGDQRGSTGKRRGQSWDLFGEHGLCAPRVDALEPAYPHDDPYPAAAERDICEPALVAGMDPGRAPPAGGTRRVARLRPHAERHQTPVLLSAFHRHGSELRQHPINAL
jgi:hypothetical protein